MSDEIKPEDKETQCVMCPIVLPRKQLDFLGRCDACFEVYKNLPDGEKPNLGVPFTPGYDSTWNK